MMRAIAAGLCILLAALQVATLVALADHDARAELRADYAIAARNAIRDQLDSLERVCRRAP